MVKQMKTKICFILLLAIISASMGIQNVSASVGRIYGTPAITSVSEREYAELKVDVINKGGEDYISVKPTSNYWAFTPDTKLLKAGEITTFTLKGYALEVTGDKCNLPIDIVVDGSDPYSGDDTTRIYGCIYDSDMKNTTKESPGFDVLLSVFSITTTLSILRILKKRINS